MRHISIDELIKLLNNEHITIARDELTLYSVEFNERDSQCVHHNSRLQRELYNIYNEFLYTCENYQYITQFDYSIIDIKRILLAITTFCDNVVITLYNKFYQTTFNFVVNSVDVRQYIVRNYF